MDLEPGVRSLEQAKKALVEGGFRGLYSLSGAPALSIPPVDLHLKEAQIFLSPCR